MPTEFSQREAEAMIGRQIEAVADLPSVPKQTIGRITGAHARLPEQWTVQVEWDLPGKVSHVDAVIFDISFNFLLRRKPIMSDLSKADYDSFVRDVGAVKD